MSKLIYLFVLALGLSAKAEDCMLEKPIDLGGIDFSLPKSGWVRISKAYFDRPLIMEDGMPYNKLEMYLAKPNYVTVAQTAQHDLVAFHIVVPPSKTDLSMAVNYDALDFIWFSGYRIPDKEKMFFHTVMIKRVSGYFPGILTQSYSYELDMILDKNRITSLRVMAPIFDSYPPSHYQRACLLSGQLAPLK